MPRSTVPLSLLLICGCFRVPQPVPASGVSPSQPDGSVRAELSAEGALLRPPTGPEYVGPETSADALGDAGPVGSGSSGTAPLRSPASFMNAEEDPSGADAGVTMARTQPPLPHPSRAGQVVVDEIMVDPELVSDTAGEWFELRNPSTSQGYELSGCSVDDGSAKPHALPAPLVLAPGAVLVVGRSAQVGFHADALLSFSFSNTADALALICDGVEIDRVAYDSSFPLAAGASMSLDPSCADASCNDRASAWCLGRVGYAAGLGTPGSANPSCSEAAEADAGAP